MGQTNKYGIRYPEADNDANVPYDMRNMAEDIENTFQTEKYTLKITTTSNPGTNLTIPCHYKVGANVLDVYLNGEKLIRSTDNAGTNGHFVEVGSAGSISNIIKSTTDWQFEAGDVLELIVRGDYE